MTRRAPSRSAKASSPSLLTFDRDQLIGFRLRAQHLDRRLPRTAVADAAAGGLQDTVPRAALFGLHARVQDADPAAWEDPDLVQTYGPRMAVYVIPKAATAAFTRGLLPREEDAQRQLDQIAGKVLGALENGPVTSQELGRVFPELRGQGFHPVRLGIRTGLYLIQWDTASLRLYPNEPPPDPEGDEAARVELAARFVQWYGPADVAAFAAWAGVGRHDAETTWKRLMPRLAAVEVAGRERFLLAEDVERARQARLPRVVRLVPPNDALLALDREMVEPHERRRRLVYPAYGQSGVVLVDGDLCGTWRRQARRVTLDLWPMEQALEKRVLAEAATASVPLGGQVEINRS